MHWVGHWDCTDSHFEPIADYRRCSVDHGGDEISWFLTPSPATVCKKYEIYFGIAIDFVNTCAIL